MFCKGATQYLCILCFPEFVIFVSFSPVGVFLLVWFSHFFKKKYSVKHISFLIISILFFSHWKIQKSVKDGPVCHTANSQSPVKMSKSVYEWVMMWVFVMDENENMCELTLCLWSQCTISVKLEWFLLEGWLSWWMK